MFIVWKKKCSKIIYSTDFSDLFIDPFYNN